MVNQPVENRFSELLVASVTSQELNKFIQNIQASGLLSFLEWHLQKFISKVGYGLTLRLEDEHDFYVLDYRWHLALQIVLHERWINQTWAILMNTKALHTFIQICWIFQDCSGYFQSLQREELRRIKLQSRFHVTFADKYSNILLLFCRSG